MHNLFAEYDNIVPGTMPLDTAATAVSSQFIDMKAAHAVAFLVMFGTVTAASADQFVTIAVEASTVAASTSGATVPFNYRVSGAVAANTWGAVTAATSAGITPVAGDATGKMYWIEVDPAVVADNRADTRWVKVEVTPGTGVTVCNVATCAFVEPRYAMATMLSTT